MKFLVSSQTINCYVFIKKDTIVKVTLFLNRYLETHLNTKNPIHLKTVSYRSKRDVFTYLRHIANTILKILPNLQTQITC